MRLRVVGGLVLVGIAGLVLSAPGCSTASSGVQGADPTQLCAALCNRTQVCDNTINVQTCESGCFNDNAAFVPKLRDDVVGGIESCFA